LFTGGKLIRREVSKDVLLTSGDFESSRRTLLIQYQNDILWIIGVPCDIDSRVRYKGKSSIERKGEPSMAELVDVAENIAVSFHALPETEDAKMTAKSILNRMARRIFAIRRCGSGMYIYRRGEVKTVLQALGRCPLA
jgi:hypothetical protein